MENKPSEVFDYDTTSENELVSKLREANRNAERAYWWMKDVDRKTAERVGVYAMVNEVLSLLKQIDDITLDITIKINRKI
ncbi:MAG: hypothetical protein NC411_10615 [Bacteroides sp.]|nr:hypothetical protein [Bacteroides sp.]